jgi:dethiobiotin synthetase
MLTIGLGAGYWKPIRTGYWKPIRTGLPYTDTDWVKDHTGLGAHHFFPETYLFAPHISPHEAAALEGVRIDLSNITIPEFKPLPHLIVEGAGGLMVPINEKQTILDVILHLRLPVLVVARSCLGTINHTTLTVDKLRHHSIPILGVVMNGPKHASNLRAIEHYAKVPVLAQVEPMASITPAALKAAFNHHFGSGNDGNLNLDFTSLASIYSS